MNKKQNSRIYCFQRSIFLVVVLLNLITTSGYVHARMYFWKDEQGIFNASEENPEWWPRDSDCIVWVPGRRKVADLSKTKENMPKCKLEAEKKKAAKAAKMVRRTGYTKPAVEKEVVKPTEREIQIYCMYKKKFMQFLTDQDPDELAARSVCKRFKISKDEFTVIYSKMLKYKEGEYNCFYH
ncbi:hypothetical protein VU04_00205 [Desulfobulbus sp. TB]|nr:hypothetical protein [Desulfobulbus sp. TB]